MTSSTYSIPVLTDEIILRIIRCFETHDRYWELDNANASANDNEHSTTRYKADIRNLARLCRVSKKFRALVVPVLYGCIRLFSSLDLKLLIRTLLQDQVPAFTLRKTIQRLSFEFRIEAGVGVQPSDHDEWRLDRCFEESLGALGLNATFCGWQFRNDARQAEFRPDRLWAKNGGDDIGRWGPAEDVAPLLLFMLPHLRYLRLWFAREYVPGLNDVAGLWRCKKLLQTMTLPKRVLKGSSRTLSLDSLTLNMPASLAGLEELVLCNPFVEDGSVENAHPPTMYLSLGVALPFRSLPGLTRLTLERLLSCASVFEDASPSGVTDLVLKDCAILSYILKEFLKPIKHLKTLHYEVSDLASLHEPSADHFKHGVFNPRDLVDAFKVQASSLERLKLVGLAAQDWQEYASEIIEWHEYQDHLREDEDNVSDEDEDEDGDEDGDDDEDEDDEKPMWLRARKIMAETCQTIDLREFVLLREAEFHITDFIGWYINTPTEYTSVRRISQVLPESLQVLILSFDILSGKDGDNENINDDFMFGHVRDLIDDRGRNWLDEKEKERKLVPNLIRIKLDIAEQWSGIDDVLADLILRGIEKGIDVCWVRHS